MNESSKKYRKAVFLVVYKKTDKIFYLILKRKLHWKGWEFPKGGIEPNENQLEAVKRELKEETGLPYITIKDEKIKGSYSYKKDIKERPYSGQEYKLFSVQVKPGKIKMDEKEHASYKWLAYKEAVKRLTWKNQKECLKIVDTSLKKSTL